MIALGQTLKVGDTGVFRRPISPLKADTSFTYGQNATGKFEKFNTSVDRYSSQTHQKSGGQKKSARKTKTTSKFPIKKRQRSSSKSNYSQWL